MPKNKTNLTALSGLSVVDSEFILLNLLTNPDVKKITVTKINKITQDIEKELPNVFVDMAAYSWESALSNYADIFTVTKRGAIKRISKTKTSYMKALVDSVNSKVPKEVKMSCLRILKGKQLKSKK